MKQVIVSILIPFTLPSFSQIVEPAIGMFARFDNVRDFCLSKNGDSAYFTIQSPNQNLSHIAVVTKQNNTWGNPELVSFSGKYNDLEPFLSPDGRRLYFVSDRPLTGQADEVKDFDIWYVERTETDGWSKPVNIGGPVNTKHDEFYPAVTSGNNLYFTCDCPQGAGKDDIWFSAWNGKHFTPPVLLDTTINSAGYEFNAYISPDEKTIIYTRYNVPGGKGSGDLYVSRRSTAGTWDPPRNLGDQINSKYMEYCPWYDFTSSTLYFTSKRDTLRPHAFETLEDYLQAIGQYQNGKSRIYKTRMQLKDF